MNVCLDFVNYAVTAKMQYDVQGYLYDEKTKNLQINIMYSGRHRIRMYVIMLQFVAYR